MTTIEYFQKMLNKHLINYEHELRRNVSEEILENIQFKIDCCKAAINALDAEQMRYGTWKLHKDGSATCMECGKTQKLVWDFDNWQRFCGCCGVEMIGAVDDGRA